MHKSDVDFLLAIDQGGHATRATIFNNTGNIQAKASCDVSTSRNKLAGSWHIEHDANELVESVNTVVTEVQQQLQSKNKSINIIAGFATQRSTIVCWNKITAKCLSSAISWQDVRAEHWLTQFQSLNTSIQELTGLYLSPHYGASKIKWCLENLQAVIQAQHKQELCIGPLSSYLLFRCVKSNKDYAVVDPANAARTLLLNQYSLYWDKQLLKLFAIPESILPRNVASYHRYGQLSAWNGQCAVKICSGDQSAAVFAQGRINSHIFKVNIGSGAFVLNINQHSVAPDKILSGTIYTQEEKQISAWEGTVNGAGIALDWFQQKYALFDIFNKLESWLDRHYRQASNRQFPIFINGISGVGSPFWISNIDTRFVGGGSISQQAVALIESIVFLLWENIQTMNQDLTKTNISISGGLSQLNGLCQRLADISKMIVTRCSDQQATCRGLAWLLANKPETWTMQDSDSFAPQNNYELHHRYTHWSKLMQIEQHKVNA